MTPEYDAWNAALSERLLQRRTGQSLYLYTDQAVLEEVSGQVGVNAADALESFVAAVRGTLQHVEPFRRWAVASRRAIGPGEEPSWLGVLCFLVLVAVERETTRFQYYPELNAHLRRPDAGRAPLGFDVHVPLLFQRFNDWLRSDGAEHGLPTARSHQHFPNVGWPLSQAVVRPVDRALLVRLFASEHLEAGMGRSGAWLRARVVPRLRTSAGSASRTRLLDLDQHHADLFEDVLLEEYRGWDGKASVALGPKRIRVRLCHDETSGEWWLLSPRVVGTERMRWSVGSAAGMVPAFKDLEVTLREDELWRTVGAGDIGCIENGPVLCSRRAPLRWLSIDTRAGGWAEVGRRDPAREQLVLAASRDARSVQQLEGVVTREGAPAGQVLLLVPAGVVFTGQELPPSDERPRLEGGLCLSSSTRTYLRVPSGLPVITPAQVASIGGRALPVKDGVAVLGPHLPSGDHCVDVDGHRVPLRLVDRLQSGPVEQERLSWVDDLPPVHRLRIPWHAGSLWLVGERGELEERPAVPPGWAQRLNLVISELDVTSTVSSTWFAPCFVVATSYSGRPWVEPVPMGMAEAQASERPRELNRAAARSLVAALLLGYGPEARQADARWKRAFSALLRTVHS